MVSFTPKNRQQLPYLKQGEVHVWVFDLMVPITSKAHTIVSETEWLKINRLKHQQNRALALSMRVQLKRLLSCYLGISPVELQFDTTEFGKPYLKNQTLSFNVSHSGSQALVAMTLEEDIGVDLEHWRYLDNLEGLVKRNFSSSEQAQWGNISAAQREETFFNIWTCKEAFIKATGRGLGMGVSRCGFSLTPPNRLLECPVEYGSAADWSCVSLKVGEKVSASLMLRSKHCEPIIYTFDHENPPQFI
ncbi:4'-phosphopantetheinyl transferase superfamily protein [Cycloclasticus sp.]|uniref:4'-phosphopantetheinyl transferase family protein n=1 Tax=Cycloclasticus sp. TaxID=2024830 RepID=UPI00257E6CB3|nr:4'-phosphopantetheinyl transferase superfamily protein [Cycloclasticus sp.]